MTGNVPFWIQRLLGLDIEPGYGMAWRIVWSSSWPGWLWWLVIAVAIGTAIVPYLRRSMVAHLKRRHRYALLAVRLLTAALLLMLIGQPELQLEKTDLPIFAVVIDDSMSMTSTDRGIASEEGGTATLPAKERIEHAKSVLLANENQLLEEMVKRYRTNIYRLSDMATLGEGSPGEIEGLVREIRSLDATGPNTRLGDAVTSILSRHFGTEPAGIVLLTDGVNTEGPGLKEAAAAAKRLGVPIYAVGIGSEKTKPRLKLSDLSVEDVVFVGDTLRFQAMLHGPGHEGETVHVDLYRKDPASPTSKPVLLDEAKLTIPSDGRPIPVQLHYAPPKEGSYTFGISIREEKGSELQRTVQAYKEQIRVLLAASRPSYEYRFLRNLLRREPSIQPTTFLADADPRSAEQDPIATPVFPIGREALFEYDVVILIDMAPQELGRQTMENLAAFVQDTNKGGAIVFIAGPNVPPSDYRQTPLARLLPVDVEQLQLPDDESEIVDGFQVTPTQDGLGQPPLQLGNTTEATSAIWRELPPLYWMLKAESLKVTARVWAVNPNLEMKGKGNNTHGTRNGDRHLSDRKEPVPVSLPVLVMQYVQAGRVLMQLTDETWRWQAGDHQDIYNRYWLQTIRYLARSKLIGANQEVTLSTNKKNYLYGEPVRFELKFHDPRLAPDRDDGVQISLRRSNGPMQSLPLKRSGSQAIFTGTLSRPSIGNYHAWLRTPSPAGITPPSADFTIEAPPGELTETQMNAEGLRDAAQQTAGHFFTVAESRRLISELPKGHPVTVEPLPPYPLWNHWLTLVILLALLTTEWALRRRWGL